MEAYPILIRLKRHLGWAVGVVGGIIDLKEVVPVGVHGILWAEDKGVSAHHVFVVVLVVYTVRYQWVFNNSPHVFDKTLYGVPRYRSN